MGGRLSVCHRPERKIKRGRSVHLIKNVKVIVIDSTFYNKYFIISIYYLHKHGNVIPFLQTLLLRRNAEESDPKLWKFLIQDRECSASENYK